MGEGLRERVAPGIVVLADEGGERRALAQQCPASLPLGDRRRRAAASPCAHGDASSLTTYSTCQRLVDTRRVALSHGRRGWRRQSRDAVRDGRRDAVEGGSDGSEIAPRRRHQPRRHQPRQQREREPASCTPLLLLRKVLAPYRVRDLAANLPTGSLRCGRLHLRRPEAVNASDTGSVNASGGPTSSGTASSTRCAREDARA